MSATMSEEAAALRTWLMKSPRPAYLHVCSKDGKEYDVEFAPGSAWSDNAVNVCALQPERVEAYSSDKKLVRAVVVGDLVKKEETAAAQQRATFTAMQSSDPETQRMIVFAELLERAYAKAYDSSQSTVAVAFTQLQEICNSLAQQANAAQQSANELTVGIRNLMIQHANETVAAAEETTEHPLEKLATNFFAGQKMAEAENAAAKTAKPNGKH